MELNWGNILHFNSEKDYYEVLGFLSKEEELIRVYTKIMIKQEHGPGKEECRYVM